MGVGDIIKDYDTDGDLEHRLGKYKDALIKRVGERCLEAKDISDLMKLRDEAKGELKLITLLLAAPKTTKERY